MKSREAEEVRQIFLDYFLNNDHQFHKNSGIVPQNDDSLLFINSGMAPLKPFFLGQQTPPYMRLTNVQDCIRTNDLESVGDSYHGSSFRMMGNWSFGNYFKQESIEMAFKLITEVFGFDKDRLYVTVFENNRSIVGVPSDHESAKIWEQYIPSDRIISSPPKDNFWQAGQFGLCGPCTEIFYDRGEEYGSGVEGELIDGRHIEIWNAGVFIEYLMDPSGNISKIPIRCVDAGAGMERFAMILQDVASIHEIDQYAPAYNYMYDVFNSEKWARIALDHLKTTCLIMREGVFPSNKRDGYIPRSLLRRVMSGLYLHEQHITSVYGLFDAVSHNLDDRNLTENAMPIMKGWLDSEVKRFEKVLNNANKYLSKYSFEDSRLDAAYAFDLTSTYGIPFEFLQEYCIQNSYNFDVDAYNELRYEHQRKSKP